MINNVRRHSMRDFVSPPIFVIAGIVAVMAITFTVIIATLNRGFDWSDEGFVYAMIASNHVGTSEFWGFQYLLNPVYEMLGNSVFAFRVVRLLGYVALGVILTMLARALLRTRGIALGRIGWLLVGLVAQIGTFAAWSYPPRYLGYNELSSWFTQLASALLLFLLLGGSEAISRRISRRWWLWPTTGLILSALILAKISAGVFLSLLAIVASILSVNGGMWWKRIGGLLGGLVSGFLLMLLTGVPLVSFFVTSAQLGSDPSGQAESGYSLTTLLATYLGSMTVTVVTLAVPILLAGIILLVVRGFRTNPGETHRVVVSVENVTLFLSFVLAVVLIAINVFPSMDDSNFFPSALDSWASLGVSNAFLFALGVLSFALLAKPLVKKIRGRAAALAAFSLFAIAPLISALGTNNRIFGHTVFSTTLWAVGAAVGLVLLWQRSAALSAAVRLIPLLLLGVIVASSGLAVAGDVFLHPYRTAPYFTQKSVVAVGDLRGIRVTESEAELYTWLHDAGEKLDADGVPALSIATPGALLAFNASGWTAVWPGPSWSTSIAQSCAKTAPKDMFVLQAATEKFGSAGHDRLVEGLKTCGINFPTDFHVVAKHPSVDPAHDIQIWQLD